MHVRRWPCWGRGLRQAKGLIPQVAGFPHRHPGPVGHGLVPMLVGGWCTAGSPLPTGSASWRTATERELEKGELDLVIGFASHLSPVCGGGGSAIPGLFVAPRQRSARHAGAGRAGQPPSATPPSWGPQPGHGGSGWAVSGWRGLGVRLPSFMAVPPLMATGRYLVVVPEMIGRRFCRPLSVASISWNPPFPIVYLMAGHPLSAR